MEQLASISAVLGGFVVTFLSVVLTHQDGRRRVGILLAVATAAAAGYLVSALGWSLMAERGEQAALHRPLSLLFIASTGLLFVVLGLGGWLRSRALGYTTTLLATVAAFATWAVLRHFVR